MPAQTRFGTTGTADRDRVIQWAVALAAVLLMLIAIRHYAQQIAAGGDPWKTGDWLIGWPAGAMRRGGIGEILFRLSPDGPTLLWLTFTVQALVYLVAGLLILRFYLAQPRHPGWAILILSPAGLFLFPFYDPQAGFRKELLVFLAFVLLARCLHAPRPHLTRLGALALYGLAAVSHEIAAFCLPFFWLLLRLSRQTGLAWAFTGLGLAGLALSLARPGGEAGAAAMCLRLVALDLSPKLCGGAIDWLGHDAGYGFGQVETWLPVYWPYLPILCLSALPLTLSSWARGHAASLLIASAPILSLALVAVDWGRWIHIPVTLATILVLAQPPDTAGRMVRVPLLVTLLFAAVWSLPHCCGLIRPFGLFG